MNLTDTDIKQIEKAVNDTINKKFITFVVYSLIVVALVVYSFRGELKQLYVGVNNVLSFTATINNGIFQRIYKEALDEQYRQGMQHRRVVRNQDIDAGK